MCAHGFVIGRSIASLSFYNFLVDLEGLLPALINFVHSCALQRLGRTHIKMASRPVPVAMAAALIAAKAAIHAARSALKAIRICET